MWVLSFYCEAGERLLGWGCLLVGVVVAGSGDDVDAELAVVA